jgi:protein-disulfide isomerase
MSGSNSGTASNSKQNLSREQILAEITSPTIPAAPVLGSSNATVTLVEFGDYQCTYCHRFHVDTKNAVLSNYVATGKVRFVFKDFPINDLSDKASTLAADASYCAADQGKYWQYHDTLYNNWQGENTGWVTRASLQQFAISIGLNQTSFTSCVNSGKYDSVVKSNYDTALAMGLNATPSFIIVGPNGNPSLISGAYPYATYQQALDKALA